MPTILHSIDLTGPDKIIRSGHLKMGGVNPQGSTIEVTNAYLQMDGKPFFGVSGEFQFSRYPQAYWEEELLKIKASGVNVLAMYAFWIHHEEQKGRFDWSGQKDVRRFVQLCAKHGLWVIARVGPFCHGECRNGGLPDWLYGQPFEVRSNDPNYLGYVSRYYQEIGAQLRGLFFKDGGPIIGLQLENEFGHTGAPWDAADRSQPVEWMWSSHGGVDHLLKLRDLANQAGLSAPLLTFTAWGSPIIEGESLPVHGGYAYPVWIDQPGPSQMYLFSDLTINPPDKHSVQYQTNGFYPSLMAEMQGGIQVRYNNRPEVPPRSTEAFALVTAGSGCNFIGYYIYHGGSNPLGSRGFTNEILHPQVSYDFQAPLGEFGEVRDSCRYVKLLHYFFDAFGAQLAPMGVSLPAGAEDIQATDLESLRWSVRSRGPSGFIFINNFQDHAQMPAKEHFALSLHLPGGDIRVPYTGELSIPADGGCILPFHLDLEGVLLESSTAQPFTALLSEEETHYFFFAPDGLAPQYIFPGEPLINLKGAVASHRLDGRSVLQPKVGTDSAFSFETPAGKTVRITTLTRQEAEHAWLGEAWGMRRLVISPADPIFVEGGIELRSVGEHEVTAQVFPALAEPLESTAGKISQQDYDHYTKFVLSIPPVEAGFELSEKQNGKFHLTIDPSALAQANDLFLKVDYTADTGAAFIDGQLIADNYNNGAPWVIGLARFAPALRVNGLTLKFRPLRKGVVKNISSAMAARLDFEGEEILRLDKVQVVPEYRLRLLA